MYTNFKNILIGASVMLALASCDEIDENDRFIHMDNVVPQRAVLLLDFTGQNCVNCPAAHEIIDQLQTQYADSLIAVSMHCGDFGLSVDRTNYERNRIGLMYAEGDEYDDEYNTIGAWPAGVVNMRKPAIIDADWSASVRSALTYAPKAVVVLNAWLDGDSVRVTADVSASAQLNGHLNLWLVEDGIVAYQRNGNTTIPDYVHNNVFRRAFNGVKGTPVTLSPDKAQHFEYATSVAPNERDRINTANIKVVGFVNTSDGVAEAARVKVTPAP